MFSLETKEQTKGHEGRKHHIEVIEHYRKFTPPVHLKKFIERALDVVPNNYLNGLRCIVLTDAEGLSHARRRASTKARKRKVRQAESLGLYHPRWRDEPAHIEIFVDNIACNQSPVRGMLQRELTRWTAASTLFHEIGHHIHYTKRPEHRERENVACDYQWKYMGIFMKRRKWKLGLAGVMALANPFNWVWLIPMLYRMAQMAWTCRNLRG